MAVMPDTPYFLDLLDKAAMVRMANREMKAALADGVEMAVIALSVVVMAVMEGMVRRAVKAVTADYR